MRKIKYRSKSFVYVTVWGAKTIFSPLAFAEGLFFSNILQILILKYCFNIEESTDLF